MREWYSEDHAGSPGNDIDILEISTQSASGNQDPVNAIPSFVGNGAIALHVHDDAAAPEETTLQALPFFSSQPFQNGIDVYMPASNPPDGTITVTNIPRGDASKPQVLKFPNWPSSTDIITLLFSDFPQD
jgi:hypothetical protein